MTHKPFRCRRHSSSWNLPAVKPGTSLKRKRTRTRHSASGCQSRTGPCTHSDDVLQHIHLHEYGLADALSDVGREHGLVMGLDPVSSTRIPPRTPGGCQLVHCPQPMDAKYQDSRIFYASICQTVPEMHAAHALRQPKHRFQLERHVAIPQGRVGERTNILQATTTFLSHA